MPAVLFVCTGNICRSPMAAALFRSKLGTDLNQQGWVVESAGTWAVDDMPASTNTQLVLQSWGVDLSDHRSRRVTGEMLSAFNLILTMESGHKEALLMEFPDLSGRVFMLSEMVGQQHDVVDPIGRPLDNYEDTAREIDHLLNQGLKRILALAQENQKRAA